MFHRALRIALMAVAALALPALLVPACLAQIPPQIPPEIPVEEPAPEASGPTPDEISDEIEGREEELERIRADLRQKRRQASELAGREHDLQAEVDRINAEIAVNRELLQKLGEKQEVLLRDLDFAHADLAMAEESLASATSMLEKRLRAIYKFGRGEAMEVILLSKTFADLAKRIYYLSVIADNDLELMKVYSERVETRRVLMDHIAAKKSRIDAVGVEVETETRNLELKKEERDALVARLKDKRYYYENLAERLEEASKDLESLIADLESRREDVEFAGTAFDARRGRLMWPCDGEVIASFGVETHPRFGTILRNNGIDIKTTPGTSIRAVANGVVSFAGALSGFGNCIVVSHGEGFYTLYGHLESMIAEKGYNVAEGLAIGVVGETSTPEGAVLHFEIRHGKKPLDPAVWLLQ
jgi:septal ring factor EnvC (AmiA/AmiB activator)